MEFLNSVKKSCLFLLLSVLILNGCKEAVAPDFNNVNDPNAVLFQGEAPSNLKITILSQNTIKLEWQNNSDYENGYIIERALNNNKNFIKIGEVGHNVTSFIDSNAVTSNSYIYRVRMKNKITNNTANIVNEPYTEKIKLADNVSDFRLSPNGEYVAVKKNGEITVLNTSDGKELFNFPESAYALSSDYIALPDYSTNNQRALIKIFRLSDGTLFKSFILDNEYNRRVSYMTFNHQGDNLIVLAVNLYRCKIDANSSPTVKRNPMLSSLNSFEIKFSEDDKYIINSNASTAQYFTIYSTDNWELVYKVGWITSVVAHLVNNSVVFYGWDKSLNFYDFKQKHSVGTIENDLNYGRCNEVYKANINNTGSILSAYNSTDKITWLDTPYDVKIDLWLLGDDYSLVKKFKTLDLGSEKPIVNEFSGRNDFVVLTDSKNLYLWKYY
jgi:hypothetical protein